MSLATDLFANSNDPFGVLSAQGRLIRASAAAASTAVTSNSGAGFANTDPTFLLSVPSGMTCVPAEMRLFQTGTVAGGAIGVIMEIDDTDRYSSGGTVATVLATNLRGAREGMVAGVTPKLWSATGSAVVATNAYGVRHAGYTLGQDVSPAEGAVNELIWTPSAGVDFLIGPASWLIYTYVAAGQAPSWIWSFKFAQFPSSWMQE